MHQKNAVPSSSNISFFCHRPIIMTDMKRLQTSQFQLRPNGQQERDMRRVTGACRFAFNRALALQNLNHEAGNKYIPYIRMASWLIEWKSHPDIQWLKDAPSQQSLKDRSAVTKISSRKRSAFPRFKKRCIPLPVRCESRAGQQSYIASKVGMGTLS